MYWIWFSCPQCLDSAGPMGSSVHGSVFISVFSDAWCVQLHAGSQVCQYVCNDVVISGCRLLEKHFWNVLQSSGMSVALDPRRAAAGCVSWQTANASPVLPGQWEKATQMHVEFCKHTHTPLFSWLKLKLTEWDTVNEHWKGWDPLALMTHHCAKCFV